VTAGALRCFEEVSAIAVKSTPFTISTSSLPASPSGRLWPCVVRGGASFSAAKWRVRDRVIGALGASDTDVTFAGVVAAGFADSDSYTASSRASCSSPCVSSVRIDFGDLNAVGENESNFTLLRHSSMCRSSVAASVLENLKQTGTSKEDAVFAVARCERGNNVGNSTVRKFMAILFNVPGHSLIRPLAVTLLYLIKRELFFAARKSRAFE
jgi:hypothetical protein